MLDLTDRQDPATLHAALAEAVAAGPTAVDTSTGAVVVLRHAEVEALSRDHRLAGIGLALFDVMGITDGPLRDWYGGLMFTNEGAEHQRLRSLVSRAFTPRSVERLRADAANFAAEAVARVRADGGGDLVTVFSLLPMRVMCRLLGVPDEDIDAFGGWADDLSRTFGIMEPDQVAAATTAITELLSYVERLAEARRGEPADDLVTALLAAEDNGERLSHNELVAMVANLLVGGHDTTASQIGCSLFCLLEHPAELARLRADTGLAASATAETIRFEPSITAVPRTAVSAVEIGGVEHPAGTIVFLCTATANRDSGVWDDPDLLDIGRFAVPDAPRLLTFGAGTHYCLGAALARLTLEEVLRAVAALDTAPQPAVALDEVPWRVVLGRSPGRLPVHL